MIEEKKNEKISLVSYMKDIVDKLFYLFYSFVNNHI